jgi:hypothetical protein
MVGLNGGGAVKFSPCIWAGEKAKRNRGKIDTKSIISSLQSFVSAYSDSQISQQLASSGLPNNNKKKRLQNYNYRFLPSPTNNPRKKKIGNMKQVNK